MNGPEGPATLAELLADRADDPNPGVVLDDQRFTWSQTCREARRRAAWMRATLRGGPPHVGVLLPNIPEYLFTLFGAAQAGAVVVGLNDTRRGAELARDVTHTDCRVVLTDARGAEVLDGLDLGGAPVVRVDEPAWTETLAGVDDRRATPADPTAASGPAAPSPTRWPLPRPDDLFLLIFTSGSTGAPKAVRMTQGRAARMALRASWCRPHDVLYCAMPLFHGNALNAIVFPALRAGATIALRERFSASRFMPDVRRYGATFFSTVGRALAYVLATPEHPDDREHRVAFALAPESSPADLAAFEARFGIPCITGYGSSENAVIMVPVPGMPPDALGLPLEGIDAAVVDPETMQECPRARFDAQGRLANADEAIGEIVGRNVVDRFEGYYRNPEADAARTRGGWYWSGDLGYRDEAGFFYFAGRTGEWLRVDSENFAVAPVERILARFPAAAGVAVIGVPDTRTADDQVLAAVELVPGATFDPEAFASFLAAQPDLGTKWAPRYVRVGTLPTTGTGKVDKAPLRAEGWRTTDPVWWRPASELRYVPLTDADRARLEAEAERHGRRAANR
jgi:fatty-acyl-CoA synthase